MAVLDPSTGTIEWRRVIGEETIGVSDGRIVRFPQLIGEGRGRVAVDDDIGW